MSNNQSLQTFQGKPKFSKAIQSDTYKNLINRTLGDEKRAQRFIAAISSAVAINAGLQECDAGTILSGALLGEALNLSPSPQLGQYYLVPFNTKIGVDEKGKAIYGKQAQFQLGYKGYIQLAIRSGQYRDIDVLEIHEGEYLGRDKLTGKQQFEFIEDDDIRDELPVVGYLAYFEYLNGFRKQLYWTKEKMEKHALQYSKGFAAKKGYTFWEKDFDSMAFKTMLRQLISKWGVMSTELADVMEKDMAVIKQDGSFEYVNNGEAIIEDPIVQQEEELSNEEIEKLLPDNEVNINEL